MIKDLKLRFCSAAISASANFAMPDDLGHSVATLIVTALRQSLAKAIWQSLPKSLRDPYRPELHYMRGPGPKWREKHSSRLEQGA